MSIETQSSHPFMDLVLNRLEMHGENERLRVASGQSAVGFYSSPLDGGFPSYACTFDNLLEGKSFVELFEEKKSITGEVYALDVMGTTEFPSADGQVVMTYIDHRQETQIESDTKKNRHVIPGNILQFGPWRQARALVPQGFNIITCRPVLGWNRFIKRTDPFEHTEIIERTLVQRMVNLLAPGGDLFLQLRLDSQNDKDYIQWQKEIAEIPTLSVKNSLDSYFPGVIVKITKTDEGKIILPRIKSKKASKKILV